MLDPIYPEFESLIKHYDIVCFSETKTDDLNNIELDGYDLKMKNRGKFVHRKSGGLVLGYKKGLASKIKVFSTASKFDFWFRIVDVPPENTRYSSNAAFAEIGAEYLIFSSKYDYIYHS